MVRAAFGGKDILFQIDVFLSASRRSKKHRFEIFIFYDAAAITMRNGNRSLKKKTGRRSMRPSCFFISKSGKNSA
jgi:hypothetical protein